MNGTTDGVREAGWAGQLQCLPSHEQKDICAVQWEWEKEIGILSPLVNLAPAKDNVNNHLWLWCIHESYHDGVLVFRSYQCLELILCVL